MRNAGKIKKFFVPTKFYKGELVVAAITVGNISGEFVVESEKKEKITPFPDIINKSDPQKTLCITITIYGSA